jgi:hypothetical protein
MYDCVGALEGAFHRAGVRHVSTHGLDRLNAMRRDRGLHPFGRPCQHADPVPGTGEGRDRV